MAASSCAATSRPTTVRTTIGISRTQSGVRSLPTDPSGARTAYNWLDYSDDPDNLAALQYLDLAVAKNGTYSNYVRYSPNNRTTAGASGGSATTAAYPYFQSGEYDYWATKSVTGAYPYYTYYIDAPTNLGGNDSQDYAPDRTKLSTMIVNFQEVANYANNQNATVGGAGDRDGSDNWDYTQQTESASSGAKGIFLGGFAFEVSGNVSIGKVPYAIFSISNDDILGYGQIDGPTPEPSSASVILCGILMLAAPTVRRYRKARATG